ncbi:actin-related protein 8 [Hyalella azteca]|uniref:Actin-related protein 8 n=1 Tax=Hyalella azteca TaxID=294128 RepID=A0A8B7NSZ6_HYAAZ|nr:actin-related protein 8 [Hyalella azteca]
MDSITSNNGEIFKHEMDAGPSCIEIEQPQIDYDHQKQLQAPVDPRTCIVLHPGSRNLRLGRPSDSQPYTVLHAIARRLRNTNLTSARRRDPIIVPLTKISSDKLEEVEECRIKVSNILQASLKSDGSQRYATPLKQIAAHNRRVTPTIDEFSSPCPPLLHPSEDYLIGDQVLNISPEAPYHIHFPWQRGDLNTHSGISGSLTAVMADLETIWSCAIEDKLGISRKEFKNFRCCVVIPALYSREHVVHITRLLLDTMGFAACFVFQVSDVHQIEVMFRFEMPSTMSNLMEVE